MTPTTPARPDYHPLSPARVADTRPGQMTIDGQAQGAGKVTPGAPLLLTVAGRAGVPAGGEVTAVALNVTAVDSDGASFVTVYPADEARPLASNLNVETGQAVANSVIAKLSPAGQVRVYVDVPMHIVVDVAGYWTSNGIAPLSPVRLADTRPGTATVDGQLAGIGKVAAGSALQLQVIGRGGVAGTATSVALNVVVTGASGVGFLTAYASGNPLPLASNLNFITGATTANQVVAPIGAGGKVSLYVSASADIVVDVAGYFTAGSDYVGLSPARVADTRWTGQTVPGPAGLTWRDSSQVGPIGVGQRDAQLDVLVYGRAGLPTGGQVGAVVLNVTITNPNSGGYVSVFPTGSGPPNASNVNVLAGQTRPNLVIAKVGRGGSISLITSIASTDLVVDVIGYIPAVPSAPQLPYYDWMATGTDGAPVSFDRCSPILYQYNQANAPAWMVSDVETSIAEIETVTGLDFVRVSDTTDSPERDPVDAFGNAKPVIIGFGSAAQFPNLAGSVVGYAGPYYSAGWDAVRFSGDEYFTGRAVFDIADTSAPTEGFGAGNAFGKVALHELTHLIGLGHVNNTDEIMNPFIIQRAGKYGAGDTVGLRLLYQTQDCPGSAGSFVRGTAGVTVPDFGHRRSGLLEMDESGRPPVGSGPVHSAAGPVPQFLGG
ncbi:MAG: matrixin family metalloprotease [Nakamurella sp.]